MIYREEWKQSANSNDLAYNSASTLTLYFIIYNNFILFSLITPKGVDNVMFGFVPEAV